MEIGLKKEEEEQTQEPGDSWRGTPTPGPPAFPCPMFHHLIPERTGGRKGEEGKRKGGAPADHCPPLQTTALSPSLPGNMFGSVSLKLRLRANIHREVSHLLAESMADKGSQLLRGGAGVLGPL